MMNYATRLGALILGISTMACGEGATPTPNEQANGAGGSAHTEVPDEIMGPAPATGGTQTDDDDEEPLGSEWQLVWSDEFEGEGLPDPAKWNYEQWAPGVVNNELQSYTAARLENARLENGSLIIEARRDFHDGHEYSSARIHSRGKGDFQYGRFEVRARLPSGRGTWPAIWMMPSDVFKYATTCTEATGWIEGCDAWPNSGEIDIMEHVGHDPGVVHGTIHVQKYNWQQAEQATSQIAVDDVFSSFHIYSLERTEQELTIFVDGQLYFRYRNEGEGWRSWPFDDDFYFIFNIAVGGSWGGAQGVDPEIFPARMEIDYVRVYERG